MKYLDDDIEALLRMYEKDTTIVKHAADGRLPSLFHYLDDYREKKTKNDVTTGGSSFLLLARLSD